MRYFKAVLIHGKLLSVAVLILVSLLVSCDRGNDLSDVKPATKVEKQIRESTVSGATQEPPVYDPKAGGWEVEEWNERISSFLKPLSKKIINNENWEVYAGSLCDNFESASLSVPDVPQSIQDGKVEVFSKHGDPVEYDSFPNSLKNLISSVELLGNLERASFKIVDIKALDKKKIQSDLIVRFGGKSKGIYRELKGLMKMRWSIQEDSLKLFSVQGTFTASLSTIGRFVDVTEDVFGKVVDFKDQFYRGQDHWTSRVEMLTGIDVGGWQGLSIADVNGDNLDDIYIAQPGGLPNRLYVRNSEGGFEDWSKSSFINFLDSSHGNLFVDLDNDGDQDLVAGVQEGLMIMENNGAGVFSKRVAQLLPSAVPYSITAADYDKDGDLDFHVCCYNRKAGVQHHLFARPVPYHDANNGGRNVLFRNDGNWQFKNVTVLEGMEQNNRRFSYAASWEDYDNDGDMDLYIANDFGRNNLYRNDHGVSGGLRFKDVSKEVGVVDIGPGMSVSWGDYDNNGSPDLYVSNMFSSAGNRITSQKRFHNSADQNTRNHYIRHARGNSLFKNLGNGFFEDHSIASGVNVGRWAWASRFEDMDGDGYQDIYVANGFITQSDSGDL